MIHYPVEFKIFGEDNYGDRSDVATDTVTTFGTLRQMSGEQRLAQGCDVTDEIVTLRCRSLQSLRRVTTAWIVDVNTLYDGISRYEVNAISHDDFNRRYVLYTLARLTD